MMNRIKHPLTLTVLLLLLLAAGLFVRRLTTNTSNNADAPISSTTTKGGGSVHNDKGQPVGTTKPNNNSDEPGDNKSNNGGDASGTLDKPTGNFVSNHHPNLSGYPAPSTETSVCVTSPGATCTISFSKDGETKSLKAQATDRSGTAYWDWKLSDLNLAEGTWNISAVATMNGQSLIAEDPLALQVSR